MIYMESLKIIESNKITEENVSEFIPRIGNELDSIKEAVISIINQVKQKGDIALVELTKKFDGIEIDPTNFLVSESEIKNAYKNIDPTLLRALKTAKANLMKFHKAQLREEWTLEIIKGVNAGQIYRPLESIGIYIPGGRAIYPSTVLMAATPAIVAGVKSIIICSPPQKDKNIAPAILVAANEFGIKRIYKVGGAQAIAAMAYGTETIPKVQKVIGPGNKWVNAAKQLLSNSVAIDTPAGPSEILIIADESADINYIIVDFLSQIEHDPDNIGIIATNSQKIVSEIQKNINHFIESCKRKDIIKQALKNSFIIQATSLNECIRVSNIFAPEHLEILVQNPKEIIEKILNAGAVFIGPYTPVPLGDYSAGTNHILPTGGNAKKYSGLNIFDFIKIIDILECNRDGLKKLSESASIIAEFEGLLAHKNSIEERLKDKN